MKWGVKCVGTEYEVGGLEASLAHGLGQGLQAGQFEQHFLRAGDANRTEQGTLAKRLKTGDWDVQWGVGMGG